jgi:hypothetical protein
MLILFGAVAFMATAGDGIMVGIIGDGEIDGTIGVMLILFGAVAFTAAAFTAAAFMEVVFMGQDGDGTMDFMEIIDITTMDFTATTDIITIM